MVWLASLLLSCSSGDDSRPPPPGTTDSAAGTLDCGPGVTWDGFGQAFLLSYCTACHGTQVTGDARHGAPVGVDLDSLEGALAWAERIRVRTLETGDMPPAGGPHADERALLEAWLDCGLPGDENPLPEAQPDPSLVIGYNVRVELTEQEGLILVTRLVEAPAPDLREGLLRLDVYRVDAASAEYHGYEIYDADEQLVRSVSWDPPLFLLGDATQATQAEILDETSAGTEDQVWTLETDPQAQVDGHALDADSWALVLTEDGGEEHGWHLSDDQGIVARWAWLDGDRLDFLQVATGGFGEPGVSDFPLRADRPWIETGLVLAVSP